MDHQRSGILSPLRDENIPTHLTLTLKFRLAVWGASRVSLLAERAFGHSGDNRIYGNYTKLILIGCRLCHEQQTIKIHGQ